MVRELLERKKKETVDIHRNPISKLWVCPLCRSWEHRDKKVVKNHLNFNCTNKEGNKHYVLTFIDFGYSSFTANRKKTHLKSIQEKVINIQADYNKFISDFSKKSKLNDPMLEMEKRMKKMDEENKKLRMENEKLKDSEDMMNKNHESEIEILKKELRNLKNQSLTDILNRKLPGVKQNRKSFSKNLMEGSKIQKLSQSIKLAYSSRNEQFDHFCKLGISFNRNFLYKPETILIVREFLEIQELHAKLRKSVSYYHFDNNDIGGCQYGKIKYHPTTTFMKFFCNNLENVDLENVDFKKVKTLAFLLTKGRVVKSITELTSIEIALELEILSSLFTEASKRNFGGVYGFFSKKRRERTNSIKASQKEMSSIDSMKVIYTKFLEDIGFSLLESQKFPTKSKEDMKFNMDHVNKLDFDRKIWTGDQPVYEALRKFGIAFIAKFHAKLNMLRAIFMISYDSLFADLIKRYFNTKKNLKTIPNGWYKSCEVIFLNVYYFFSVLLSEFMKKNKIKTVEELKKFKNYDNINILGYKLFEIVKFVTVIGFPFYLLVKSIKENNWDCYILSMKLFLRWILSTSERVVEKKKKKTKKKVVEKKKKKTKKKVENEENDPYAKKQYRNKNTSSSNYFRLFILHLYDLFYRYNDDVIRVLKQNFTFSYSENNIPFDEVTEMENDPLKPTGKSYNPLNTLLMRSRMHMLIKFFRQLNKIIVDYTKERKNDAFLSGAFETSFSKDSMLSKYKIELHNIEAVKKRCMTILETHEPSFNNLP